MSRRPLSIESPALPHPAEDLSADDDLLSWILVDQLGAMPNTKLGVHPQQVKFVGSVFKTEEVLKIVQETVIRGKIQEAMQQLQEFYLIKKHLEGKTTDGQRERFIQHLRRYLLPLAPTSRLEIHTTARYTSVSGHTELAVFATRNLPAGVVLQELQGSVVPLPDAWREEMEIGEDFAVRAAGEETSDEESNSNSGDEDEESIYDEAVKEEESDNGEDDGDSDDEEVIGRRRRINGKEKESERSQRGARRSDRTKRRDFSIVWSGLKRCFQLFLGPARFLNHDCAPNVELLRQGKYVTFRVIRPIRIGDELTTFYGDNYFGKENIECLCLTCEQNIKGGFTPKDRPSATVSPSRSRSRMSHSREGSSSLSQSQVGRSGKPVSTIRPSGLRNPVQVKSESDDEEESNSAGPSKSGDTVKNRTPTEQPIWISPSTTTRSLTDYPIHVTDPNRGRTNTDPTTISTSTAHTRTPSPSPSASASRSPSPILRTKSTRAAAQAVKPWAYLKFGHNKMKRFQQEQDMASAVYVPNVDDDEDLPDDFPRCVTCARALNERIWYGNRWFDHCQRCTRHALIFDLPWPAHRAVDVMEYPPPHLLPPNYLPPRITSIPLPSLSKVPKRPVVVAPRTPPPESREFRRAQTFRNLLALEEFTIDQLRLNSWNEQLASEAIELAKEEAKQKAKRDKEEAKEAKKRANARTVKGSGVWSRYEYLSVEEMKKRVEDKWKVTNGTRRGGRFRDADDEEEMREAAERKRRREVERKFKLNDEAGEDDEGDEGNESGREVAEAGAGAGAIDGALAEDLVVRKGVAPDSTMIEHPLNQPVAGDLVTPVLEGKKRQSESEASPSSASDSRTPTPPHTVHPETSKPAMLGINWQRINTTVVKPKRPSRASLNSDGIPVRPRGRPAGSGHLQRRAAKLQKDLDASTLGSKGESSEAKPVGPSGHEGGDVSMYSASGSSAGVIALLEGSDAGDRSNITYSDEVEVEGEEVELQIQMTKEKRKKRTSDESDRSSAPVKKRRTFFPVQPAMPVVTPDQLKTLPRPKIPLP